MFDVHEGPHFDGEFFQVIDDDLFNSALAEMTDQELDNLAAELEHCIYWGMLSPTVRHMLNQLAELDAAWKAEFDAANAA